MLDLGSMKGEVQLESVSSQDPGDSDPLLQNKADSSPGSSTEITVEDVESGSVPCCRICLESDAEPGKPRLQKSFFFFFCQFIIFMSSMKNIFEFDVFERHVLIGF